MNDELENLSDYEVSDIFAVEVAKLRGNLNDWRAREVVIANGTPNFCASADAVLPWLEKQYVDLRNRVDFGMGTLVTAGAPVIWNVRIIDNSWNRSHEGRAVTFARAACIALIRFTRGQGPMPQKFNARRR